MEKVVIVSGGAIEDEFAREYIEKIDPDTLVAADSGLQFFFRAGITPDYVIGDFDSVDETVLQFFKKKDNIRWETLIPEKDDTDTEHAIRSCIREGAKAITVLGATGTRLDHVFGNICLLGIGLESNVRIWIVDSKNRLRMIKDSTVIEKTEQFGNYVSVFPFLGDAQGVTITGAKYPLERHRMKGFQSLGVSNEIVDERMTISVEQGYLVVMETRD